MPEGNAGGIVLSDKAAGSAANAGVLKYVEYCRTTENTVRKQRNP
jgi:hypothetical protein